MLKSINKPYLISIALVLAIAVWLSLPETTKSYTAYGHKFIIQDSLGQEIFSIDDSGFASDEGAPLIWDANSIDLPAPVKPFLWSEGFELRNQADQIIFYVEDSGNVHLAGSINAFQVILEPVGTYNFILENQDGEIFAYIDSGGSLYIMGKAVGN